MNHPLEGAKALAGPAQGLIQRLRAGEVSTQINGLASQGLDLLDEAHPFPIEPLATQQDQTGLKLPGQIPRQELTQATKAPGDQINTPVAPTGPGRSAVQWGRRVKGNFHQPAFLPATIAQSQLPCLAGMGPGQGNF